METEYSKVKASDDGDAVGTPKNKSWIPFLRQCYVCSTLWTSFFLFGLIFGSPTVTIPQMRRENNATDYLTDEMATWITSSMAAADFIWLPLIPVLSSWLGRKYTVMISSLFSTAYFVAFYFCPTPQFYVLTLYLFKGFFGACQLTLILVCVTEFSSPRYRGLFITLKSASFYWGIWVANALGTYLHWKTIGLVGMVISLYLITNVLFWPESPLWLAGKGRFEECRKTHRWLKGTDEISENELENLIESQSNYLESQGIAKKRKFEYISDYFKTVTKKEYLKACFLSIAAILLHPFSGKPVATMYAIDIMKTISNDEATAYFDMLVLDGFTVFGMYMGCILTRYISRRIMLFSFTSLGILFLYITSLYLFLIRLSIISESKYLSLCLLVVYSIAICCGPMIMATSIYAEIAPLRYRGIFMTINTSFTNIFGVLIFKYFLPVCKKIGLDGSFLFFAVVSSLLILMLYIYLPETKDKNFKEIEESLQNSKNKRIKEKYGKNLLQNH